MIAELQKIADWQRELIGRQEMQMVVLKWAVANREALDEAGLTQKLVAVMDTEIAIHRAASPSKVAA